MLALHILRELLIWLGPIIGVIAVGQEAEGSVEETIAVERAMSFKFTASATVKVSSLSIKLGAVSGTGTSGRLALQADEGGTKPKEGVLCEGPIASVAAGEHTTTSLTAEPEVVSGTVYWLTIMPLGGNAKIKCGTTTSRQKTSVNRSLISIIVAADWAGGVTKGPASIWATGTEGGTVFSGALAGAAAITGSISGRKVASGGLTALLAVRGAVAGAKAAVGSIAGALAVRGAVAGQKVSFGTLSGQAALRGSLTGAKSSAVALVGSVAVSGSFAAQKRASGSLTAPVAIRGTILQVTVEAFSGPLQGSLAVTGAVTGRKVASASLSGRVAITGAVTQLVAEFAAGGSSSVSATGGVTAAAGAGGSLQTMFGTGGSK